MSANQSTHSDNNSNALGNVGDGVSKPIFPLTENNLSHLARYDNLSNPCALYSLVDLPAGSLFAKCTTLTLAEAKAYSSVQVGRNPDMHIELNSALLYCNHSCSPSLEFRVMPAESTAHDVNSARDSSMPSLHIHVSRQRALKAGDELSFFYPSTEWSMARPFECLCIVSKKRPAELKGKGDERAGGKEYGQRCLGVVRGAEGLDADVLREGGWWLNEHIEAGM